MIPNVVDETVANACAALKTRGNAGWLDYVANADEEVAIAERYVMAQEPGPEGTEAQRARLVVPGSPGKYAALAGSVCLDDRS